MSHYPIRSWAVPDTYGVMVTILQVKSTTFLSKVFRFRPLIKWIWKNRCIMKLKVFAWLLLLDRLNTEDMLRIRRIYAGNVFYVTNNVKKQFITCSECIFSQSCWEMSGIHRNFSQDFIYIMLQEARYIMLFSLFFPWKYLSLAPGIFGSKEREELFKTSRHH